MIDKDRSVPESGYLERTLAMSLSPIEIVEDDCGCTTGLNITPFSKQHIRCLAGKYWKKLATDEWKILKGDEFDLIDQRIMIRSPMTCKTENFRICKKCFGERHFRTRFIGITAGQVITERLTQLLMRSFHTSGSSELDLDKTVSDFMKDCLIDIKDDGHLISLEFNTDDIPNEIRNIRGYLSTEGQIVKFTKISEPVVNNDVLATVIQVKELMKKDDRIEKTVPEYYKDLMSCILEVGDLYSSFVEIVLAHMFMTGDGKFWRYNQGENVTLKLSEKTVASKISPLLGFAYTPNRLSINELDSESIDDLEPEDIEKLCFHEKVFLNKL